MKGVKSMVQSSTVARADAAPVLHLDRVDLRLKSGAGDVHVLKDITLSLPPAATVSITGPSGSGKTTLLMVLGGLEKPDSGTVTVAGRSLSGLDEDALASFRRDNIGIIFQGFHLIPSMTALENVAVPLEFAGYKDAFARAAEALAAVGLKDRVHHYPGQLSGGEQQRVAIARAFVTAPRVILADEPTGNLDPETAESVFQMMVETIRTKNIGALIVTHNHELAARMDRVLTLKNGVIVQA